jgi:hypothetical protein
MAEQESPLREASETEEEEAHEEEFGELLRYTAAGFAGGLALAALLDSLGFQRSAVGQWLVRTLAGEGESILEGVFAFRKRVAGGPGSMAEVYGWGKLAGMGLPWLIDWGSRAAGIDVYGLPGFYIPYFYALSDQIGGNVSGLLYLHRREKTWGEALSRYLRHPVMMTGLAVILLVPIGLLGARMLGFSPTTQTRTALETIAANLCWLPPLVGWISEQSEKRAQPNGEGDKDHG